MIDTATKGAKNAAESKAHATKVEEETKSSVSGKDEAEENFEYFCDISDGKIDAESEGRYHYGGEEDGLDITVGIYRRFDSLSKEFPKRWAEIEKGARNKSAWRFIGPARMIDTAAKGAKNAAESKAHATKVEEETKSSVSGKDEAEENFEYFCDISDGKIDAESEGRYHYGGEEDGLDITVGIYRRFDSLSKEFPKRWAEIEKGARNKSAWRFIIPAVLPSRSSVLPAMSKPDIIDSQLHRVSDLKNSGREFPRLFCAVSGREIEATEEGRYLYGDGPDEINLAVEAMDEFSDLPMLFADIWATLPPAARKVTAWTYAPPFTLL